MKDTTLRIGEGRLAHAPAGHPPVKTAKTGVLVANLGTPDGYDYWPMRRYLSEFLSDRRVMAAASATRDPVEATFHLGRELQADLEP